MKKLMMLSALVLLTVVCVRAEINKEVFGTCDCPGGKKGTLNSTGGCFCSEEGGMTGTCSNVKCANGQSAMMTGRGCKCKPSPDAMNNGPVMRMNAPKPS